MSRGGGGASPASCASLIMRKRRPSGDTSCVRPFADGAQDQIRGAFALQRDDPQVAQTEVRLIEHEPRPVPRESAWHLLRRALGQPLGGARARVRVWRARSQTQMSARLSTVLPHACSGLM